MHAFVNLLIIFLDVKLHLLSQSVVALGSSMHFSCISSILSPVIYQWEHNGSLLHYESGAVLGITNVQWNETGVYRCIVTTKSNISVASDLGYLTVYEPGEQSL